MRFRNSLDPRKRQSVGEPKGARIVRVDRLRPEPEKIRRAAALIRAGGIVAFPTETVYGLAADAFNPDAVEKVFAAKGRPPDNPVIVHIARLRDLSLLAHRPSRKAAALIKRFWPGPLTVVLRRKQRLPGIVCAHAGTVAVRVPDNRIALALIRAAGTPLVGPSANLSGRPSPTRATDVAADLGSRIDLILDGGRSDKGIESTVIDMTVSPPQLLRHGAITAEEIAEVIGPMNMLEPGGSEPGGAAKSPGLKYRHYAPKAEMILVGGPPAAARNKIGELAKKAFQKRKKVGIISFRNRRYAKSGAIVRHAGSDPKTVAKRLYAILRDLDKSVDLILSESFDGKGAARAVADRLLRAAGNRIIRADPEKARQSMRHPTGFSRR